MKCFTFLLKNMHFIFSEFPVSSSPWKPNTYSHFLKLQLFLLYISIVVIIPYVVLTFYARPIPGMFLEARQWIFLFFYPCQTSWYLAHKCWGKFLTFSINPLWMWLSFTPIISNIGISNLHEKVYVPMNKREEPGTSVRTRC